MQKFIVMVGLAGVLVGSGYGQALPENTPEEIQNLLDGYVKDSTSRYGFSRAKRSGYFSDSVQFKDLKLRSLAMYRIKHIFLNECSDTVSFGEIIEPFGYLILAMAHNKPLYELFIDNTKETPEFAGMASMPRDGSHIWEPLLKDYPQPTWGEPVLVSQSSVPFLPEDRFFYFKHKGPREIRYLKPKRFGNSSLDTLSDSQNLIRYWKKQGLNEVGTRGTNRTTIGGG